MGRRGPAPKPTALRRLEGNPSGRPLPQNEPYYPPGVPSKPKKISRAASPIWDELVAEMAPSSILRRVDRRALSQLAEDEALLTAAYRGIWAIASALKREAISRGQKLPQGEIMALLQTKNGRLAMNTISHLAQRTIIERREFGMTPASRSQIDASFESKTPMDSLEMKLCG